jgi:hypothetical protein
VSSTICVLVLDGMRAMNIFARSGVVIAANRVRR